MTADLLTAALDLATRGVKVFPCVPNGKRPLTAHGFKDATDSLPVVRQWWTDEPQANIAIPTGAVNGVAVYDADVKGGVDGEQSLRLAVVEADLGELWSAAPLVRTPSGGLHLYLAHPGEPVKNRAGALPGLDVRGDGGYVLVPPSVVDGKPYTWLQPWDHTPPMWRELVESAPQAAQEAPRGPRVDYRGQMHPRAAKALREECEAIQAAPEGTRNHQVFKSAAALFSLAAAGDIDEADVVAAVTDAARHYINDPRTGRDEFEKTLASARKAGLGSPREPARWEPWIWIPGAGQFDRSQVPGLTVPRPPLKGAGTVVRTGCDASDRPETPFPGSGTMGTVDIIQDRTFTLRDRRASLFAELRNRAQSGFRPIPSGIGGLDELLGGGARRAAVTLLCGPPGVGKTSLAVDWALHAARPDRVLNDYGEPLPASLQHEQTPVLIWSLEMPTIDIQCRMLSLETGAVWGDVREGKDVDKHETAHDALDDLPIEVVDNWECESLPQLMHIFEKMKAKHGKPPMIIVDYAQLIVEAATDGDARLAAERASKMLRQVAVKEGTAVLALSAVGRGSYNVLKKDNTPDVDACMRVAKESGKFEFDSSTLINIAPVTAADEDGIRRGWIVVAKARFGGRRGAAPVAFHGVRGRYQDVDESEIPTGVDEKLDDVVDLICREIERRQFSDKAKLAEAIVKKKQIVINAIKHAAKSGLIIDKGPDGFFCARQIEDPGA